MFNGDKNISVLYPYHDVEVIARNQKRILFIGSFGLLVGYMICAGVAYKSTMNTKATYDKVLTGAGKFMSDTQSAICTDGGKAESFTDCDRGSFGDFLSAIKHEAVEIFDSGLNIVNSIGAMVTAVGGISTHIDNIGSNLTSMEQGLNDIDTNLTAAQAAVDSLPDGVEIDYPSIERHDDVIKQLQAAQSVLEKSATLIDHTEDDLHATLVDDDSQVGRFRRMIDHIPGNEANGDADLRGEVLGVLNEGYEELAGVSEKVSEFRDDHVSELKGAYDVQFKQASLLVFALLTLPGALLLLLSLCAMTIKSPKPFYCSMAFGFFGLGIYCMISGLFLALSKFTTDTCNNIGTLLVTNLPDSYEFTAPDGKLIQIPPLGEVAVALSQCQGFVGYEPSNRNNFIDILQLGDLLDLSDMLNPAITALNDVRENFASQDITNQLEQPIDAIPDEFDFDVDEMIDRCSEAIQESSSILSQVPPADFDRDDPGQVELFENFYLSQSSFSWNAGGTRRKLKEQNPLFLRRSLVSTPGNVYSLNAEQLSVILRAMQASNDFIGCGGGFFSEFDTRIDSNDPPLSYNFVKTLDYDKYCASGSGSFLSTNNNGVGDYLPYCPLYSGSGYTAANVCPAFPAGFFYAVNAQTEAINTLDEKNTELVNAATAFNVAMNNVKDGVMIQKSGMDNISEEKQHLKAVADFFSDFFDTMVNVNAPGITEQISHLNDVLSSANRYAMCGFVGVAYDTIIEEAICTDLEKDMTTLAACLLSVALLMFMGFCFHGIYAISLRKRIIPGGSGTNSKGDFNNGIYIPNRTPPASPTELASVGKDEYFHQPILVSPQGSFEFQKPPPISPGASISSYVTEPCSPQPLL